MINMCYSHVLQGDHSTKIEAVIYKIITIHDNDPYAKILVFSQVRTLRYVPTDIMCTCSCKVYLY